MFYIKLFFTIGNNYLFNTGFLYTLNLIELKIMRDNYVVITHIFEL